MYQPNRTKNPWFELSQFEQKDWYDKARVLIDKGYVETDDVETTAQLIYKGYYENQLTKTK